MQKRFTEFIANLARTRSTDSSFNMYSGDSAANTVRRNNLLLYFQQMEERKPEVLLVGEAPGYQGTRQTGVGFCSEYIILNGIPEIGLFGKQRGYRKTDEFKDKVWKEPSATIVWGTLAKVKKLPLIWASFPFHPHQPGNALSNRTPTKLEVKTGQPTLQEIIKIFKIKTVVAVGGIADWTLTDLGIVHTRVRHPSHGGKNEFTKGIAQLLC